MSLHEQSVGATDEWYTPPHVFTALGCAFDVDVASPGASVTPWIPAGRFLTHSGLETVWHGLIWMNPPFGGRNALVPWLDKFIRHGCGIALVPDRTSAPWWQQAAPEMDAMLFVAPKIRFIGQDGEAGRSPDQGTTLMALGTLAVSALHSARKNGLGVLVTP